MSADWRAAAAADADRAATTQEQFIDATRRDAIRHSLATLRGAHSIPSMTPTDRRTFVAKMLAQSVEKQARFSGLGRVTIPVGIVA